MIDFGIKNYHQSLWPARFGFCLVKKLNFTDINIRGLELVENQGDMNIEMLLDYFDEITKYIPENSAYYRSWKSK